LRARLLALPDALATIAAGDALTARVVTRAPRESLCVPPDLRSEIRRRCSFSAKRLFVIFVKTGKRRRSFASVFQM
jgi:hypothetical protein